MLFMHLPLIFVCYYIFGECLHNLQYLHLQKVKDSWRVINHRDIIPTVPRLMGYCHVAQPVYLAAGDLTEALVAVGSLFWSIYWPIIIFL